MKIPKTAKRVFKGIIFDVYQWQQKLYDGSKATFEALKRPGAVRIIAIEKDKIILNREKQPACKEMFGTFGGRIEPGETPLACAKRELLEESGLKSSDWKLLNSYELYPEKMECNIYVYVARNCEKIQKPKLDKGEKIKSVAVTFDKFMKIVLDQNSYMIREFVLEILRIKNAGKLNEFKKKLFKK